MKCKHEYPHLCPGAEDLMHVLKVLDVRSAYKVLVQVGKSMRGERYFYDGTLRMTTRKDDKRWLLKS